MIIFFSCVDFNRYVLVSLLLAIKAYMLGMVLVKGMSWWASIEFTESLELAYCNSLFKKRKLSENIFIWWSSDSNWLYGSRYSRMDLVKFVEDNLLKNLKWHGLLRQTISLKFFNRLSSTNFNWSIFEYLDPYLNETERSKVGEGCQSGICTAQKMKFSIKYFSGKCEQIRRKLRICSHLLEKYLMENFIFCAVL